MLDRCPTCGKTIGTLMESHPDKPSVIEILSRDAAGPRIVLILALACCSCSQPWRPRPVPLARAGVSIDRCSLLRADGTTGSSEDVLPRLIFV
jgi:hypothetical protein